MAQLDRRDVVAPAIPAAVDRCRRVVAKVGPYARLAKLDVFDLYLSTPVVWSALAPAERLEARTLVTLCVFLLGAVCLVGATCASDDLTGYRDGSDAVNYGNDARSRRLRRKPLLTGALTTAQAVRFATAASVAGTFLWALAAVVAPHRPRWALFLMALAVAAGLQYSWGAKLSYRGFQEVVLAFCGASLVLAPYGLVSGGSRALVVVEAVLFGLGPMLFGLYANTNDVRGDAQVSRRTVAATLSASANKRFILMASVAEMVIIVAAPTTGIAPRWFLVAMTPVIALRSFELVVGLRRDDTLRARRLGMRTHRTTVGLLVAVNIFRAAG